MLSFHIKKMMDLDINDANPEEYIKLTEDVISTLNTELSYYQSQTFQMTQQIFSIHSQITQIDAQTQTLLSTTNLSIELETKQKTLKDLSQKSEILSRIFKNCTKKISNKKFTQPLSTNLKKMKLRPNT